MKITIEKVSATSEIENNEIVSRIVAKIEGLTRIEEAFNEISNITEYVLSFNSGKGSNHIWVSNWRNERLMIITETRKN
jgi:hypothetical protein